MAQQMHECYSIANQDCLEVLRLECGNENYITYKKGNETECLTFNQKYTDFYTVAKRHKISTQDNSTFGWLKFFKKLDTFQLQEYRYKKEKCLNEKWRRMKEFEIAVLREGLDKYYQQLYGSCDLIFEFMGDTMQERKENIGSVAQAH